MFRYLTIQFDMCLHSRALRDFSFARWLLIALTVVVLFDRIAYADHSEEIWASGDVEAQTPQGLCGSLVSQFEAEQQPLECGPSVVVTSSGVNQLNENTGTATCSIVGRDYRCSGENHFPATSIRSLASINMSRFVVAGEHEEEPPLDCSSLAGQSDSFSFTDFFDGPSPDLAAFACQGGCEADVLATSNTRFENITGSFEAVAEDYTGTYTFTGVECSSDRQSSSTGTDIPANTEIGDEASDPPNCTADYYTSPITGEIVCGTPQSNSDGSTTSQDQLPDGSTSTTTEQPDGSTTTTVVDSEGNTTTTAQDSAGGNVTPTSDAFGNPIPSNNDSGSPDTSDGGGDCPSNIYVLQNGVSVCRDDSAGVGGDIVVNDNDEETNSLLTDISGKLDFDAPSREPMWEPEDMGPEITAAREELSSVIGDVQRQISNAIVIDITLNDYTCNRTYRALGQTLEFCIPPQSLELIAILGTVLLALANLYAVFIVMRGIFE